MDILNSPLLRDIEEDELKSMRKLNCIKECRYEKNTVIFHIGDIVQDIGIVMKGSVNIENIDLWGSKSILSKISDGGIFAEVYALCREPMMVDVISAEECFIMFFNINALTDKRNSKNSWHSKMLVNLLEISMRKNLALSERILCTAPKTIRERLLIFLSSQSAKAESTTFQIPFNR